MRLLGAHLSIAGGLAQALWRGKELGCDCIQLFTKNANQWRARSLTEEAIAAFALARAATGVNPVAAHDSYLINLASPDAVLFERSVEALIEERRRAALLGLPYLVIHPGSHRGSGEQEGLLRIARGINRVLSEQGAQSGGEEVVILLETTAGQGAILGSRFEHLAAIIERITLSDAVGVCLDTCHSFAAGYDIRTAEGYEATLHEFERVIGLVRLKLIHVNDSQAPLGARRDRHTHIGQGHMGKTPFRLLLQDLRLAGIPLILETPKGKTPEGEDWDRVNLQTLRELS
jgi:deoxyribonuclease-4